MRLDGYLGDESICQWKLGWRSLHRPERATPGLVEFVEELPKTSTGKVQKYELRKSE